MKEPEYKEQVLGVVYTQNIIRSKRSTRWTNISISSCVWCPICSMNDCLLSSWTIHLNSSLFCPSFQIYLFSYMFRFSLWPMHVASFLSSLSTLRSTIKVWRRCGSCSGCRSYFIQATAPKLFGADTSFFGLLLQAYWSGCSRNHSS